MEINHQLAQALEDGIERGRFDYAAIEGLLHRGCDAGGRLWGESYLHALADSAAEGVEVVARLLLAFGAKVDALDAFGAAPLARACRFGNLAMARELLRCGACVGARDQDGQDAMICALERADEELVSELLSAGYPAKLCKDGHGRPGLVCIADHPKGAGVAFELLFRGADPDGADADGWTPLAMASRSGNAPMVSMLLSERAKASLPGPGDLSPIAIALGARAGKQSPGGSRVGPAHIACALRLARELGPTWGSGVDARGETPLGRLYCSIGRFESDWMEKLRVAGADCSALNERGWSLLRLGAEFGSEHCGLNLARWAASHGADAALLCEQGVLPEEAASARGRHELSSYLRSLRERGELGAILGENHEVGSKRL